MKTLLTFLTLDLYRNRWLFAISFCLGFAPYLVLTAPQSLSLQDVGWFAAILLSFGAFIPPLILGWRLMVGDINEQREGFFFHRPIRIWKVWLGKLVSAGCVCWLILLLLGLPTTPVVRGWYLPLDLLHPAVLLSLLYYLVLGHALAVVFTARSWWILVDLFLGGLFAFLLLQSQLSVAPVVAAPVLIQPGWLSPSGQALLALLAVALLIAGTVQVCRGRSDLKRGHRLLSVVLWGILLPAGVGLYAHARAQEEPPWSRLDSAQGFPIVPWIFAEGLDAEGDPVAAFFNSHNGEWIVPPAPVAAPPAFDIGSGRMAWIEDSPEAGIPGLRTMNLHNWRPWLSSQDDWILSLEGLATATERRSVPAFALAYQGRRAAVWIDGTLQVLQESQKAPLITREVAARAVALEFVSFRKLLIFAARGGENEALFLELLLLDAKTQEISSVARYDGVADLHDVRLAAQWPYNRNLLFLDRFILRRGNELVLHRQLDGSPIARLGVDADPATQVFLAREYLAVLVASEEDGAVHFYGPDGDLHARVVIGPCREGRLASRSRDSITIGCRGRFLRVSPQGIEREVADTLYPLPYQRVRRGAPLAQPHLSTVLLDPQRGLAAQIRSDAPPLVPVTGSIEIATTTPSPPPESPTP